MTSSILWLTKMTLIPLRFSPFTTEKSASTSFFVSAVVGSSMIRILTLCAKAREIAISWRLATGSVSTIASKGIFTPILSSAA